MRNPFKYHVVALYLLFIAFVMYITTSAMCDGVLHCLWFVSLNTEYTGSSGYNSVFKVCYIISIDVDVILDTCSTIEIITSKYMLS